jgi:hypothetical protein
MSSPQICTGLTPVEESFPAAASPIQDQLQPSLSQFAALLQDPPAVNDTIFNVDPFESWLPNQQYLLTAQAEVHNLQDTRRNTVVDLVDHSLVAVPSFFNELQTYGQIVGPSQGLQSDDYVPSRPLQMLTSAGQIPGELYSSQADLEPSDHAEFFDPFAYTYNFRNNHKWDSRPNGKYAETPPTYPLMFDAGMPMSDPRVQQHNNLSFDDSLGHECIAGPLYPAFNLAGPALPSYDPILFQQMPAVPMDSPQTEAITQRKESSSSDASTNPLPAGIDKKLPPTEQVRFLAELPEKPVDKPWVRVNTTTKGKTSRTGKINHYDPDQLYSKVPHPLSSAWSTSQGKEFKYNQWHELTQNDMTTSQLRDFIYEHPKTKTCKLTLFIQRSPADSKRRYPTSTLDKCRFKDCPMRTYGNKGSFLHGHYRVALDELSYSYGKGEHNDPFLVAGYVHLYCLERFLDLPEICRLPHIRVEADGRQIAKEPNGAFAPSLGGSECRVAVNFIEAARKGRIQDQAEWHNYPSQAEYQASVAHSTQAAFKIHRYTLNYALQMCKNAERGGRVMSKLKSSNVAVHRGDLDMYCLGRKNMLSDVEVAQINADIEATDSAATIAPRGTKRRVSKGASAGGPRKQVKYF